MKNKNNIKEKRSIFSYIILYSFIIYTCALFLISWLPGKDLPKNLSFDLTTLFHFSEFFILSCLSLLLVIFTLREKRAATFFIIGFGVSFLTEFGQYFIPGRACVLSDFFANIAGFFILPIIVIVIGEFIFENIIPKLMRSI